MIYAIDFDGTLCEDKFPEIGEPYLERIETVKTLHKSGIKIILWTSRNGDSLERAVEWCKQHGLVFDAINENLPELQAKWGGDTRKVYCDYYIDDKNLRPSFLDHV